MQVQATGSNIGTNTLNIGRQLNINSLGLQYNGGQDNTGAIRLVDPASTSTGESAGSGSTITLSGNINLGGSQLGQLRVDGGGNASQQDQLNISGVISGAHSFVKNGPGQLEFSGSSPNTFTNNMNVFEGTLLLNKTGTTGTNGAIGTATLIIGDDLGGSQADVVRFLASNQLATNDNQVITLQSSGLLDLNGFTQTLQPTAGTTVLTEADGPNGASVITTGTGQLILNSTTAQANVSVNQFSTGDNTPAQLNGNLVLTGGSMQFIVNDTPSVDDWDINATISGTSAVNRQGGGNSRVTFTANNSGLTGNTTLVNGETVITNANAFGTAQTVQINSGQTLDLSGGISVPATESLVFGSNGSAGFSGAGALRNLGGTNTWAGPITLGTNTTNSQFTIGVNAGTSLNLTGSIGQFAGAADGILKLLGGTLALGGSVANSYSGQTQIYEGTLQLAKTGGVDAIAPSASGVIVSNDNGSPDSDVLQVLGNNEIDPLNGLIVTPAGKFDLNGFTQSLSGANTANVAVQMYNQFAFSADVDLKGGTLAITGSGGFLNSQPGAPLFSAISPPVLIQNSVPATGGLTLSAGLHTVNTTDFWSANDFKISAAISGAGAGLSKISAGTLLLSNSSNSYTGVNTVEKLVFGGAPTGTFTITFDGATTAPITYSATPATLQAGIQAAFDALLGTNAVTVQTSDAINVNITFGQAGVTGFGGIAYAGNSEPAMTTSTPTGGTITVSTPTSGGTTVLSAGTIALGANNALPGVISFTGGAIRGDGATAVSENAATLGPKRQRADFGFHGFDVVRSGRVEQQRQPQ